MTVLCAIAVGKLVALYEKFGEKSYHYIWVTHLYLEEGDSRVFRKVGVALQDYTFPYPRWTKYIL